MQKMSELELVKENILPLRQGRNISSLKNALAPSAFKNDERIQKQQEFENELRTYKGNDPLEVWCRYIQWVEQNYPQGGKGGKLPELVRQCVATFLHRYEKRYHNDPRYIETWFKYASDFSNNLEVYTYMHKNNVGCQLAIFYENWSWQLQQSGNTKQAYGIVQEGLQRDAQPKKILLTAEKRLQAELVKNLKKDAEEDAVPLAEERVCLGELKPQPKNTAPISRVGPSLLHAGPKTYKSNPDSNSEPQNFQIFNDENDRAVQSQTNTNPPAFGPAAKCHKENLKKPGKWAGQRLKQTVKPLPASEPAFTVHEDKEEVTPLPTPRKLPTQCNILSATKPQYKLPSYTFEPPDPYKIPMYNKYKVYGGAEEFQFEEIRAAQLMARKKETERLEEQKRQKDEIEALKEKLMRLEVQISGQSSTVSTNSLEAANHSPVIEQQLGNPSRIVCDFGGACQVEVKLGAGGSRSSSYNHSPTTRQVRDLWNVSLFHNSHTGNSKSELVLEDRAGHSVSAKPEVQDMEYCEFPKVDPPPVPFAIYEDEPENQENVPPKDYVQTHCKRSLAGILQQSTDIAMAPIEDQEEEEEDDDDAVFDEDVDLGVCPLPSCQETNYTSTAVMTREQFNASVRLKFASTPFQKILVEPAVPVDGDFTANLVGDSVASGPKCESSEQEISNKFVAKVAENVTAYPPVVSRMSAGIRNLSPIMEGSREGSRYKSSSSSGSCTSGAYLTSSSNLYLTNNAKSSQKLPVGRRAIDDDFVKPKNPEPTYIYSSASPIDPFSTELQAHLLKHLKIPLSQRNGYEKKATKIPRIIQASAIEICGKSFVVLEELKKSVGTSIYLVEEKSTLDFTFANELPKTGKMIMKIASAHNEWEFYISDELHRRLEQRLQDSSTLDSVVLIDYARIYSNKSILLSTYKEFGTLVDLINATNEKHFSLSESLILYFTFEMLQIVSQVHACSVVHADIKPDNFLVGTIPNSDLLENNRSLERTCCLCLIDFGQSIDMQLFLPGTSFTQQVKTDGFQCTEMLDRKPWTYQTDLFGLLGCIHIMLFSKYMQVQKNSNGQWEITSKFKRYWQKDFWENLFHTLLNVPSCESIPNLRPFIDAIKSKLREPPRWKDLVSSSIQLQCLVSKKK